MHLLQLAVYKEIKLYGKGKLRYGGSGRNDFVIKDSNRFGDFVDDTSFQCQQVSYIQAKNNSWIQYFTQV